MVTLLISEQGSEFWIRNVTSLNQKKNVKSIYVAYKKTDEESVITVSTNIVYASYDRGQLAPFQCNDHALPGYVCPSKHHHAVVVLNAPHRHFTHEYLHSGTQDRAAYWRNHIPELLPWLEHARDHHSWPGNLRDHYSQRISQWETRTWSKMGSIKFSPTPNHNSYRCLWLQA